MPELRYNLLVSEWVIISAERAKRPDEFAIEEAKAELPPYLETCPFCPGNEDRTPPEVFRYEGKAGWQVRVVPNKFPALTREGERVVSRTGTRRKITGVGIHDVIIDHPQHNMVPARMEAKDVESLFLAYRRRYREIIEDPRVEMVIPFKNHGYMAGSSIEHIHSQIIGTPMVSIQVRSRMNELLKFYDIQGECALCNMIREETREQARIVIESDHFLAFIPYAALSPFHTWVFPKRHCSCFGRSTDEEIHDLSGVLHGYFRKLHQGLSDPPFNYVIRSCTKAEQAAPYVHWYLSVVPRVTTEAGFELGSGMHINTSPPEESARFLRRIPL